MRVIHIMACTIQITQALAMPNCEGHFLSFGAYHAKYTVQINKIKMETTYRFQQMFENINA